jgi:uncharacterized protein (TIGR02145 family)
MSYKVTQQEIYYKINIFKPPTASIIKYGRLYNWYAIDGLAPSGWHIPTDEEWTTLGEYLGGLNDAGGKLKQTGITNWTSPNTGATNESGFTALPGGRMAGSFFNAIFFSGYWWTNTELNTANSYYYRMFYNFDILSRFTESKAFGKSIRLLRDNLTGYSCEQLTDADGNKYDTVQIGTQVWTVQNYASTKYADGTSIPNVTDATEWSNLSTGAYCNYNNDESYV